MVKRRLKPFVMPSLYIMCVVAFLLFTFLLSKSLLVAEEIEAKNYVYVSSEILMDDVVPVIKTINKNIVKPFTDNNVKLVKSFYDYKKDAKSQEDSLIYYNNTYIQSTGVSYSATNMFNCMAVLDGEVIKVKEDDIVGKTVIVKHNTELISVYQSLGEVSVKENDKINQGDIIGTSGVNEAESDLGNHLHFELIYKNEAINPEDYYGKTLGE